MRSAPEELQGTLPARLELRALLFSVAMCAVTGCSSHPHLAAPINPDATGVSLSPATTDAPPGVRISTNQVERLIPKWLEFCKRLDLDPGGQRSIADVDWKTSFSGASPYLTHPGSLYSVRFKNEVLFQAINDLIVVHVNPRSSQAIRGRPAGYTATNHWQELARGFEALLEKAGVPREYLNTLKPVLPDNNMSTRAGCWIGWYDPVKHEERIRNSPYKHVDEVNYAVSVAFDMQSGHLVHVSILDLKLAEWQEAKRGGGP